MNPYIIPKPSDTTPEFLIRYKGNYTKDVYNEKASIQDSSIQGIVNVSLPISAQYSAPTNKKNAGLHFAPLVSGNKNATHIDNFTAEPL